MQNKKFRFQPLVLAAVILSWSVSAQASAPATTSHSVTISVPNVLSVSADLANFTLTMQDFTSGSLSDTQTVNYTIKSNANALAANATMVSGKLVALFSNIDFMADPGVYNKTAGNFGLTEAAAGDILIGSVDTSLAVKSGITGTGKITRGVLPITYKAKATADLDAQTQTATLTITVVDL